MPDSNLSEPKPNTPSSSTSTLTNATLPVEYVVTPFQSSRYDLVGPNHLQLNTKLPAGPKKLGQHGDLDSRTLGLAGLPDPWKQLIHTDGKPYYHHSKWKVVTEDNMRLLSERTKLDKFHTEVNDARKRLLPDFTMEDHHELYLTLNPRKGYYYVDHSNQTIWWLDEIPLERLDNSFRKRSLEISPRSIETWIEMNYYRHLEHFPTHNKLPEAASQFLRGALIHAVSDHITSRDSSTSPWNADDCNLFLGLLESFGDPEKPVPQEYQTWFVSRLLCNILNTRFLYRFGMHEASVDRLASLEDKQKTRSVDLFSIISTVVFLSAPHTYIDRLEKLWADRIVSLEGWQKVLNSLLSEWSDSNLLATVTLSANMALLALQDLNNITVAASIASAIFAIGSIVIGLHHVWRHRVKVDTNAGQAATYLMNSTRLVRSLNLLAFFLSLPLVLLMWSMITFAIAIAWYAFNQDWPWWTVAASGSVFGSVLVIVVATLFFFWGIFDPPSPFTPSSVVRWWNNLVAPPKRKGGRPPQP